MVAQIFSFLFKLSNYSPNRSFLLLYLHCWGSSRDEWAERDLHYHKHNLCCCHLQQKERSKRWQTRKKEYKMEPGGKKREKRKMSWLQWHSSVVRHLLFYCNLMALLSPGATRQSHLYHMAIISVALFCDLLTLSTVTRDPLKPSKTHTSVQACVSPP